MANHHNIVKALTALVLIAVVVAVWPQVIRNVFELMAEIWRD